MRGRREGAVGQTNHMEVVLQMLSNRGALNRATVYPGAVHCSRYNDDQVGVEDDVDAVGDASFDRVHIVGRGARDENETGIERDAYTVRAVVNDNGGGKGGHGGRRQRENAVTSRDLPETPDVVQVVRSPISILSLTASAGLHQCTLRFVPFLRLIFLFIAHV